jgi:hypothetical protein
MNFIEAALLIQGSACVYSKKVGSTDRRQLCLVLSSWCRSNVHFSVTCLPLVTAISAKGNLEFTDGFYLETHPMHPRLISNTAYIPGR